MNVARILIVSLSLTLATTTLAQEKKAEAAAEGKFVNLVTNPLGLAFGVFNVRGDFNLGAFTLGPEIVFGSNSGQSIFNVGARFNLFFNGEANTQGWLLGSSLAYASSEGLSAFAITALAEYLWMWDGGFNIGLGAGIAYYSFDADRVVSGFAFDGILPALEFTLGYAF